MKIQRRSVLLAATVSASLLAAVPMSSIAQANKNAVTIGVTLEPNGLDPSAGAASSISEVTLYNIYETLTKFNENGTATPLLAESWTISPDQKTYTFKLRTGVKFHNGEPFSAASVKYSFERAAAEGSTNKDKAVFTNIAKIDTPDPATVVLTLKNPNPDLLLMLGQGTAIIVEPKSAATNGTQPVGTGPYKFDNWAKGSAVTLSKWDGYRNPAAIKIGKATFRFISDQAASVAALLAGDVDAYPRGIQAKSLDPFKNDPRFQVLIGNSRAKTILSINNKKKPLDDVRVRRAIAAAIDRKAVIDGAVDGLGTPIGSHYVPGAFGYVDTTGVNPYNVEKAKALLAEAGVKTPLELSLKLPPPPYARQGGEIIAAQLAKVGIVAKIENVEWAQWLDGVYKNKNYDLSIVSHVEAFDFSNYAKPDYYFQYDSAKFRELIDKINTATKNDDRAKYYGEAQRLLATDAVNGFLFAPQWATVTSAKLSGVWKDQPIFVNDLSALAWK
ncbi:ABC transporter substrate-binding protein [Variovorax terrae]|uniref:ABC transporter substrate-binding protein n=1 Tax=Variovorax terrae TaxID=2923278 RepID=A0A9X2ASF9_9BURK|nr:ABC transporter substrate-binding protein [Variovorax terrae]MCJ0765306.1 ABC transporter substrate-binding protein [Variovorax terrae]